MTEDMKRANKNSTTHDTTGNAPCEPVALVDVQLMLGQVHLNNGNMADAFSMFEVAARSGDPRALNMLGRAFERGWSVSRNPATAAMYFAQAARCGDGWAMFNLADLYLAGDGVAADPHRACALYVAAARNGVAKAFNMLGIMVEDGVMPHAQVDAAATFFHAAAMAGDCWGCLNLGRVHLAARDVPAALTWLEKALELGFADVFRAVETLLAGSGDPRLRRVAQDARRRLCDGTHSRPAA